jgi:hypothetical protein
MRNDGIYWGIGLVLFGGLLLLQNFGLLPVGVNVWTIFWPLVLIFIGVRLLIRSQSRMDGSDYRQASGSSASSGPAFNTSSNERGEAVSAPLGSARRATIRIHHGAGELRIDGNAAPTELFSGTFVGGLDSDIRPGGEEVSADLRPRTPYSFPDPARPLNWTMGLNPNVPMSLNLEIGASRNFIDLQNVQAKDIRLETGASATELTLPARAGDTRAMVKSGAAEVNIRIPDGVSAVIRAHGGLASISVDTTRFPKVQGGMESGFAPSGEYRSPDYEVSGNRVDLDIEMGMGSVTVR